MLTYAQAITAPFAFYVTKDFFVPKDILFCHKHTATQKRLSRLLSIQLRQSALRESRSFQYLLKCYQNHSERLMAINVV